MLCGGTMIPVSELPSSGPLSVSASTSASAAWLSVFIRYSSTWDAAAWPGPTNQKSVPGAGHWAVTSPPDPACSTSSPWAMAPVAWTTTPPRPGVVATAGADPPAELLAGAELLADGLAAGRAVAPLLAPACGAAGTGAAAETGETVRTP